MEPVEESYCTATVYLLTYASLLSILEESNHFLSHWYARNTIVDVDCRTVYFLSPLILETSVSVELSIIAAKSLITKIQNLE